MLSLLLVPSGHALLAFMPTNQHNVKQNRTAPISSSGVYRIFQAALPGYDMFTPLVDHLHKIERALHISVEDNPFYFYIFVVRKRYNRLIRHGNLLKVSLIIVASPQTELEERPSLGFEKRIRLLIQPG
jgi:hypothetical protein